MNNKSYILSGHEDALVQIIRIHRRTQTGFDLRAETIFKNIANYKMESLIEPGFDVDDRKYNQILAVISVLYKEVKEYGIRERTNTIEEVKRLIKPPVPDWDAIELAYNLLQSLGYKSAAIEGFLASKPDVGALKIKCA